MPTKDDLFRVAQKLLPGMERGAIEYVVGYSLASKGFFQAITDAIEDARLVARRAGRAEICFGDLKAAITDWRSPSDAALQRVFQEQPKGRKTSRAASDSGREDPTAFLPRGDRPAGDFSPVALQDRTELSLIPN